MTESDKKISNNGFHSFNDEVDLKELFNVVWNGKKLIILITAVVAILSIVYSLTLTNYYRSESILVSVGTQNSGSLSKYSGLASLAGVSLPSSGSDPVIEIMEIIKSREFVKHLLTFENVLPSIMAAKSYDERSKEINFEPKAYNGDTKSWLRDPTGNKGSEPSYLEAYAVYLGMLSISQDIKTSLVFINIEHLSPVFAKDFLALIIKEANTLKREKDIDASNKALGYLKKELSRTSLTEIKESINKLIEAQLETQMMAKINEEYSLAIIEPPFIPEERFKPSRSMIVILATILGGLFSTMIILVRHYFLNKDSNK